MRSYGEWDTAAGPRAARSLEIGEDTREVLAELGLAADRIEDLIGTGAAVEFPNAG